MHGLLALSLGYASAFTAAPTVHARRAASVTQLKAAAALPEGEHNFRLGILGDLHVDPRDLDHTFLGRDHMKKNDPDFIVSLGDLGESKDCTESEQLYAGTTACFELVREYFDGFGVPFNVVGGNHDLEGIDEFNTDADNLETFLRIMGKETPQFAHEIAPKTLLVGLGSTVFRDATYTSHEVFADAGQVAWFEKTIAEHPAEDGWNVFCFSHAPIIGSGLRVLQENHVVNGSAGSTTTAGPAPRRSGSSRRSESRPRLRRGSRATSTSATTTRTPSPSRTATTAGRASSPRRGA